LRWAFMGPFETIDLNAPGGIADYAARYADLYFEMTQHESPKHKWSAELIGRVESERRGVLPADRLAERTAWRDRRLMLLAAHKARAERSVEEPAKGKNAF
jgi:L-gulonate 3-dehydrogenase